MRDDVYRLYLVFRTLDDLVDEGEPGAKIVHLARPLGEGPGASTHTTEIESKYRDTNPRQGFGAGNTVNRTRKMST